MKNLLLTLNFSLSVVIGLAQTITFTFHGEDAQTNNFIALQSVYVKNVTMDCDTTIYGVSPSITFNLVGINENKHENFESFKIKPALPNPFEERTIVILEIYKSDYYNLSLISANGSNSNVFRKKFPVGLHKLEISSSTKGLLLFHVTNSDYSESIKLLNNTQAEKAGIKYIGAENIPLTKTEKLKVKSGFEYNLGDQMLFTANAGGYYEETIEDAPDQSTDYTFEMTPMELVDGFYIVGSTTACPELNLNGLMSIARNEVVQEDREQLKEIFMAVEMGGSGFNIVKVNGSSITTYGPGGDFNLIPEFELDPDEPKEGLWRGSLIETEEKFELLEDGLYHIAFDEEIMVVVAAKVEWGMIGAATPGGWGEDSQMLPSEFNLYSITFEITDLFLTPSDWKFRYSHGWKVILDPDYNIGGGNYGIKVNSNLGGSIDNLIPGGWNITNEIPGIYTSKMFWNLGQPLTAELIKTGGLPLIDYTNTELGLVGTGLIINGVQHNWDETVMLHIPTVVDTTNYYWTWENVEVTTAGNGFKIREGQTWNNIVIGYNEVTMAGQAAGYFTTNGDGNIVPLVLEAFDFELYINAVTEIRTLTVNLAGSAAELFMVGNGCTAGWDNTEALPMDGSNGEYTITTELLGEPNEIKFITTFGQWVPMYGTDENQTPTGGNLVYRETEADPDPPAIFVPAAAGTYTVTVNTNDMTYTIVAAK